MRRIVLIITALLMFAAVPASAATVEVAAAGDVASSNTNDTKTADLVVALDPALVLMLGDGAYPNATLSDYRQFYDPTWGRFKSKTFPAVGNHEYNSSSTAAGYVDYFGVPTGMRSKVLGDWLIVSLNSQKDLSGQATALTNLLKSDGHKCELVFWHRPRFSSGFHGDLPGMQPLWAAAVNGGVDVVLNGHDHHYERFAQMSATGSISSSGAREFIVGTGGIQASAFKNGQHAATQAQVAAFGVLDLTLSATSYAWEFRKIGSGTGTVADSGNTACH